MAWTAVRTWAAGEELTAALLNQQVRDNLDEIAGNWSSYTPSWTGASSNPAIGNGTLTGARMSADKLTGFRVTITMGSTTTYGSGQWRLTLPANVVSNSRWVFDVELFDSSAGTAGHFPGRAVWSSSGYLELWTPATTAGNADRAVTSSVPFTWATSDVLFVAGFYEAS